MNLAPFAALESRLNSAVQARLANATAVHLGGNPFGVLLDRTSADPFGGAVDTAAITWRIALPTPPASKKAASW